MRLPRLSVHVIALAALPLAACNKAEPAKKADDQRSASGEILEGSASDAMLPLDSVRSQPPMAPKADNSDSDSKSGKDAPDKERSSKPSGSAAPKPAAPAAPAEVAGE